MKKALLGSLVSAALLTSFNLSAASAGQAVDAQAATDNASKVSQQKIDSYAESAESALAQYKAALHGSTLLSLSAFSGICTECFLPC